MAWSHPGLSGGCLPNKSVVAGRVEIARSFSYKLSQGVPQYESRDFFCSEKAECEATEAESVSEQLYQFCKREVLRAVKQYREELRKQYGQDILT